MERYGGSHDLKIGMCEPHAWLECRKKFRHGIFSSSHLIARYVDGAHDARNNWSHSCDMPCRRCLGHIGEPIGKQHVLQSVAYNQVAAKIAHVKRWAQANAILVLSHRKVDVCSLGSTATENASLSWHDVTSRDY